MGNTRRRFTAEFKREAVRLCSQPGAVVILTPVTIVSGLAAAARKGILIKGGTFLEQARLIKAVALDKTGAITEGKPRLVHWEALSNSDPVAIGASLAARSDHPVSKAIAEGLPGQRLEVADFEALVGRGVQGRVDGAPYTLGNHRLIHDRGLCNTELEAKLAEHETAGRTVTLLASDGHVLAQSDIGFAMGGVGTDVAMEAADVVIMTDDPRRVATTIRLSRDTHSVLWQNIVLALGIKAVFLVLAVFGSATMWMAVFADMGASLLVVANGLRLLRR